MKTPFFCILLIIATMFATEIKAESAVGGVGIGADGSVAIGGVASENSAVGGIAIGSDGSIAIGGAASRAGAAGGVAMSRNGTIVVGPVATGAGVRGGFIIPGDASRNYVRPNYQEYCPNCGDPAPNLRAALSFSPGTGKYGMSRGEFHDLKLAEDNANSECGQTDCRVVAEVKNGCATTFVANATNYNLRSNFGPSRRKVEDRAYESCIRDFGNCHKVETVCTPGAY
jgi:hypothetical protein